MGFFAGLAHSLTPAINRRHEESAQKDAQQREQQLSVFKYAASAAEKAGDTSALAQVLRSMGDFSQAGLQGGKKGKAAQETILHKFADMLESGRTETQPDLTGYNPTDPMEGSRPRRLSDVPTKTVRKPLIKTRAELKAEDFESEKPELRYKADLQGELEDKRTSRALQIQQQITERQKNQATLQADLKAKGDVNKLAASLQSADPELAPEEAKQIAGQQIQQKWLQDQATAQQRAEYYKSMQDYHSGQLSIAEKNLSLRANRDDVYARSQEFKAKQTTLSPLIEGAKRDLSAANSRIGMLQMRRAIIIQNPQNNPLSDVASAVHDVDEQMSQAYKQAENSQKALQDYANQMNDLAGVRQGTSSSFPATIPEIPRKSSAAAAGAGTGGKPSVSIGQIVMHQGRKIRVKAIQGGKITDYEVVP